jgi:chloramphenicol-sensitive protein RarD
VAALPAGGLAAGFGAYLLWGFLPLYFPLLEPAGPFEIVAHRIVWSLLFCVLLLVVTRTWRAALDAVRDRRTLLGLALASVLIAINWVTFVFGVLTGHTVDAALGYYINPLVTVALAVLVLGERMRPGQWAAVGVGTAAVVVMAVGVGRVPWIALVLAASFGLYGLVKNRVGRRVPAIASLAVETATLTPVAGAYLLWLGLTGAAAFGQHGGGHVTALVAAGVVTAVPLLLFGSAARRLPLRIVGLLQYLTPTLQFAIGVLVFGEEMPAARWWGFGLVWLALVVLTTDGLRAGRAGRLARRAAGQSSAGGTTVNP